MLKFTRAGDGPKLVLVHGLGSSRRAWDPVLGRLAREREVIALDLPAHGESPPEPGSGTFAGATESVERFLIEHDLRGADLLGSSMGARIVLELARRGGTGDVVALDPGGFWRGWERSFFRTTIGASAKLLRALRPLLGALSRSPVTRTALLAQLSARPWALEPELVARELRSFADTPTVAALIRDLAAGPPQQGPAGPGAGRITIGWGRQDRLCLPRQAARALAAFPEARLHWFDDCGHFPMWDRPAAAADVILAGTGSAKA